MALCGAPSTCDSETGIRSRTRCSEHVAILVLTLVILQCMKNDEVMLLAHSDSMSMSCAQTDDDF